MRRRFIAVNAALYASAAVGDILCSDLSVIPAASFSGSGKTAIAVVFSNTSNKLKAIALTKSDYALWWGNAFSSITNLADIATVNDAKADNDGRTNTNKILAILPSISYAAGWCNAFSTAGTVAGNWYLPAAGEWWTIYQSLSTINASLSTCSGTALAQWDYYWSSTHYGNIYYDAPYYMYALSAWLFLVSPYSQLITDPRTYEVLDSSQSPYISVRAAIQINY
jgi:hypothetical protein